MVSKAWVTAVTFAATVSWGAPPGGYGPTSAALSAHRPGVSSGSLNWRLSDVGVAKVVRPLAGTRATPQGRR